MLVRKKIQSKRFLKRESYPMLDDELTTISSDKCWPFVRDYLQSALEGAYTRIHRVPVRCGVIFDRGALLMRPQRERVARIPDSDTM